jgi:hypothetical protein
VLGDDLVGLTHEILHYSVFPSKIAVLFHQAFHLVFCHLHLNLPEFSLPVGVELILDASPLSLFILPGGNLFLQQFI